jgi:UDP-glucose 4-epimerase
MKKSKTYLVTGGAGFIGSHMCERLLKNGNKVVCFDNLSTGKTSNIDELKKNRDFIFVKGDANKIKDISPIFKKYKFDGVFHYAAVVGVKRTLENPLAVLGDIDGIKNILELALKNGKPKVVFASSSEVYGEPTKLPEREDGVIDAKLPYASVKLIGENFLEAYWQKHKLKTCSLRFFNVYGPRQESSDYGFVVGIFIKQVLAGKSPTVFGEGKGTRDFVFIEDNVEAGIRAMESNKSVGQVINVGRGQPVTILNLANIIIDCCGQKGKIEPKLVKSERIDIMHRAPEISRMKKILNFHPAVSLEDGLLKTIDYYKNIKK